LEVDEYSHVALLANNGNRLLRLALGLR